MTVRVERVVEVPAAREEVWAFISDPEKRARPISIVEAYDQLSETEAVWHISLPIPVVERTVTVETEETIVRPPEYVEFEGRSRVMNVVGEHELEESDGGTHLTNLFTVDGRIPGVERFFRKHLEAEQDNLVTELYDELNLEE